MKNAVQIMPLIKTVIRAPKMCVTLPAIKLPIGIIPAKVNIKTLIRRPLNSSGEINCNDVFIRLIALTDASPITIKIISEKRYDLDKEKNISATENITEDKTNTRPFCRKLPSLASNNAAAKAPNPEEDISMPKPLGPTFNISLANIGIRIM